MKRFVITCVIAVGVFAGTPRQASAQGGTWADRGYFNVGWGVESGSSAMTDTRTRITFEEAETVTTSATFTSGSLFDVAFGLRVWKNLTVGGAYHQEQNDTEATISGSVPSPIFFNRPRSISGAMSLDRKEQASHLQIGWVLPFNDKFDVLVYGGPSFFRLTQDSIDAVGFVEQGGAFTSVVVAPTKEQRKKSVTGYNAGVDATYIVWSNDSIRIGAGGFARFTQAKTTVLMLTNEQDTDLGGAQFGFGARIRF